MTALIRRFKESDLEALEKLERECFSVPWSKKSLWEEFSKPNSLCFVAEKPRATILGYIGAYFVLDECYITNLAVAGVARREGIGRALAKTLLKEANKLGFAFVTLEVRESNNAAISLYESLGFEVKGKRKEYYSNPAEDAVLMTYFC